MGAKIHATALVHHTARLDDGVEVGAYSVIQEDVSIGRDTEVGPHCVLAHSEIGARNVLTASVFIGTPPQDVGYRNEKTRVVMGDDNVIREGVSIHRGTKATCVTVVGSGCMFMANSHVGHDAMVGDRVILVNSAALAGHARVGDRAIISGLAAVHQFVRVGSLAMVGGGSMVSKDIPPFCIAQGDRAGLVGLNVVGLRRAGFAREAVGELKEAYRVLFMEGLRLETALARLGGRDFSAEARAMVDFCRQSKRGLARPRMHKRHPIADTSED